MLNDTFLSLSPKFMTMPSDNELLQQASVLSNFYKNDHSKEFSERLHSFKTTLKIDIQKLNFILE